MNKVSFVMINGIDYLISHRILDYVYLIDVDNPNNFLIRKVKKLGTSEYLEVIEDDEYNEALNLFKEKYN
ncbi:MAG: hypothetical protein J5892_00300 [Bacilli bacterium]|nr:hypothetical protein [Bacilli bacterium]